MRVSSPWPVVSRAGARGCALAGVVLALAACGSDSTSPGGSGLTPDQLTAIGESIASEVEGTASVITVWEVSHPSAAVRRVRAWAPAAPLLRASLLRAADDGSACPAFSPAAPADADHDGVPDQASLSFTLPDCQASDPSGNVLQITGTIALSDPTPSDSGVESTGTATNFAIRFLTPDNQELLNTSRSGTWATTPASGGVSQDYQMHSSISVSGLPALDITAGWTSVFTPATGASVFMGGPLPLGSFTISGPITVNDGLDAFTVNMETTIPLEYDAVGCANRTTSFTGGEAHASFSGALNPTAYVKLVWSNCDLPSYTYVPG